ncbi:hypothetical protein J6590_015558 [Homalodisca vitripennis]|nr:hypothetical protein J6590_015558 [Homalodisca vitripennis]
MCLQGFKPTIEATSEPQGINQTSHLNQQWFSLNVYSAECTGRWAEPIVQTSITHYRACSGILEKAMWNHVAS